MPSDNIGDPNGIMSGATRFTKNPKELLIAQYATKAIVASGYFKNNFSMQMGSGGASLAVARYLRDEMIAKDIKCRFALGGITGQIVQMHEEGLVKKILDVQSFDLIAANSVKNNRFHQQIDASYYASYVNKGAAVMKYMPWGKPDTLICWVSAARRPVRTVWPVRLVMR